MQRKAVRIKTVKRSSIELKTFLIYFLLCQVFIPLFIRSPNNAGDLGPLSQWRLFSFSYGEYSRTIIDFPCINSDKSLLKDQLSSLPKKVALTSNPKDLIGQVKGLQNINCDLEKFVIYKGLPYEYFLEKKRLPVIKEAQIE